MQTTLLGRKAKLFKDMKGISRKETGIIVSAYVNRYKSISYTLLFNDTFLVDDFYWHDLKIQPEENKE